MNNSLLFKRLQQANHPKSRKWGMLVAASPLKNRSYSCNNAGGGSIHSGWLLQCYSDFMNERKELLPRFANWMARGPGQ